MKLKSLALIISAFSFVSATHADATPNQINHFYVGAGLGAIGLFNNWNSNYSVVNVEVDLPTSNNATSAQTGNANINGTFLAGYAWYLPKNTFLGVEIFDNITNVNSNTDSTSSIITPPTMNLHNTLGSPPTAYDNVNTNSSVTLENVYGVRALPGYQLNADTVLYGIVGFARAHASSSTSAETGNNYTNSSISISADNSSNFNGYQLGLGSMLNLSEHLAIRADIIFTMYGTQTLANQTIASSDDTNIQVETTAKPSTLEGDISLVYMFG